MGRENWVEARLEEVVKYKKGKKPNVLESEEFSGSVPYINIEAFETGKVKQFADVKSSNICERTDVLVVWDGARFGLAGSEQKGAIGSTIMSLTPIEIEHKFLLKYIQSKYSEIQQNPKGTGIPHVNPDVFWEFQIPLPPLAEQQRIVEKLDAILPRLKAAKNRLEKIPVILKRFRQSILADACSGKLTEDWREKHPEIIYNLKIPEIKDHDFDIPESWKVFSLKNISDCRLGKMLDKSKNRGKEVKYLRNTNVRWMSFDLSDISTLKAEDGEIEKLSIQNGDILICEGGEPGRAAVWNLGENEYIFQKAIHRVRLIDYALPQWLVFNLKNDSNNESLFELFTGTTIKHLTGQSLAKYKIPLPPLPEQQEIVRRVEKLFALADSLESKYQRAMQRIEKIEQAVLAKAFRGELAEQDPADEPAEALLQRIVAEKKKLVAKPKKAKAKKYPSLEQPLQAVAED